MLFWSDLILIGLLIGIDLSMYVWKQNWRCKIKDQANLTNYNEKTELIAGLGSFGYADFYLEFLIPSIYVTAIAVIWPEPYSHV